MRVLKILLIVASFTSFVEVEGAMILGVFPYPSKSHVILGQPIFVELAKRGHEVVFISPFPMKNPPKGYRDIVLTEKGLLELYEEEMKGAFEAIEQNPITMFSEMFDHTARMTEFTIIDRAVQQLLNSKTEKFDLVFLDTLMNEALLGLSDEVDCEA
jgi:glucuronosyltransferase